MKLRFSPRAVVDLTDIADYVREKNPEAAARVRTAMLQSIQILAEFP